MPRKWHKEKCVYCSLCTVLCPYEAFQLNKENIEYFHSKCIDCEECIASVGCPRKAIN